MSGFSAQMPAGESENLRRQALQALGAGRPAEAAALLKKARELNPSSAEVCNDLARVLARGGQHREADALFLEAIRLAPQEPYFLNSYGVFLMMHFRYDEALEFLERALALKPGFHEITNNLGLLHHRRGEWKQAEGYFLQTIQANPSSPAPHGNLAALLRDMKQDDRAEAAYKEALRLAPNNPGGWRMLAEFYQSIGKYEDAVAILKRLMSRAPLNEEGWAPIVNLQEKMNRLDDAAATLAEMKSRFPFSLTVKMLEARLLRRANKTSEALSLLQSMGEPSPNAPYAKERLFEMGQLYDRAGDADAAFSCFAKGNAAVADSAEAKQQDKNEFIDGIIRFRTDFTPAVAAAVKAATPAAVKPGPVFLVGFPRSGTTLLDQILSSHPRALVAEEQPVMNRMTMGLVRKFGGPAPRGADAYESGVREWLMNNDCYPACLADMSEADAEELRQTFYAAHNVAADGEKVFVDKFPLNLRHAGLIHRLFPGAKFILALRHPCDSVLSCFMQQFQINPAMMAFLELESSARLYDEVFQLWDLYAASLPLNVHTIRYEDVVADFRPTVASLLDFLGLEWDDAVLEYDKTARARRIATPSYSQVSEKIYTRASGRWQRYRKHLEPIFPILEPHTKKHGYSMDPADVQE